MRISDWSSDVCSSDLAGHGGFIVSPELNELVDPEWRNDAGNYEEDSCWAIVAFTFPHLFTKRELKFANAELLNSYPDPWERLTGQIGRESCRERVCQYV